MRESLAVDVLSGSGSGGTSLSEALERLGSMVPAACPAVVVSVCLGPAMNLCEGEGAVAGSPSQPHVNL